MKRAFLALALALAACEEPQVSASADRAEEAKQPRGSISGQVVYQGARRGRVVLLLFDVANPPPPLGRGRPKTFTVVEEAALFAGAPSGAVGPFTAPYAFHQVPAGTWLVTALLDGNACAADGPAGCRGPDWIPWFGVTNEPNTGDVAGGHVDLRTGALSPVTLAAVEGRADAVPVENVPVVLSDTRAYPFDRPAFTVDGFSDGPATLTATTQLLLTLNAAPLHDGPVDQRSAIFAVRYVDDNLDGAPDDANSDGLPDLWPRVFVRKLSDDPRSLADENDADKDGKLDAEGTTYPHHDPTADGKPALVVLAAGLVPTELYPQLENTDGTPNVTKIAFTPSLLLLVRPAAIDAANPAKLAQLHALPPGRYAVIVQQFTGQTWRLPNEAAPGVGPALGLPALAGQGFFVQVPAAP